MLKKAPICTLSRSKSPKRIQLRVTDIRQEPVDFFLFHIVANLAKVPLQKFLFLYGL